MNSLAARVRAALADRAASFLELIMVAVGRTFRTGCAVQACFHLLATGHASPRCNFAILGRPHPLSHLILRSAHIHLITTLCLCFLLFV